MSRFTRDIDLDEELGGETAPHDLYRRSWGYLAAAGAAGNAGVSSVVMPGRCTSMINGSGTVHRIKKSLGLGLLQRLRAHHTECTDLSQASL